MAVSVLRFRGAIRLIRRLKSAPDMRCFSNTGARSCSSRLSHSRIWFQLTKMRLTSSNLSIYRIRPASRSTFGNQSERRRVCARHQRQPAAITLDSVRLRVQIAHSLTPAGTLRLGVLSTEEMSTCGVGRCAFLSACVACSSLLRSASYLRRANDEAATVTTAFEAPPAVSTTRRVGSNWRTLGSPPGPSRLVLPA
jgi:hypothetical protein